MEHSDLQPLGLQSMLRFLLDRPEVTVKRDDDYSRALMLEIEASEDPYYFPDPDADDEMLEYYHLQLLCDAGFLKETGSKSGVFRMTNSGHDFVVSVRDENNWTKTKKATAHLSGVTLGILKDVALELVRNELRKIGLLPK